MSQKSKKKSVLTEIKTTTTATKNPRKRGGTLLEKKVLNGKTWCLMKMKTKLIGNELTHLDIYLYACKFHRGSYMRTPVLLILFNEFRKRDKM